MLHVFTELIMMNKYTDILYIRILSTISDKNAVIRANEFQVTFLKLKN